MNVDNKEICDKFMSILMTGGSVSAMNVEKLDDVFDYVNVNDAYINDSINYAAVETMAFQLSLQINALEDFGYSMLFIRSSDILVIDKTKYLLANLCQLVPLYKKNNACFTLTYPTVYPFPKEVCAPEVLAMKALPFISHRSACYYSLALLCLKMLRMTLDDLQGTKLFYFLERCLKDKPEERQLLFL